MYHPPMASEPIRAESIEEVRGTYERMVRDRQAAGREVPAQPVYLDGLSREDQETARQSVEASQELYKRAQRQSYVVAIDLKALEAARKARAAASTAPKRTRGKRRKRA